MADSGRNEPVLVPASDPDVHRRRNRILRSLVSFVVGILFALGLTISGMTHPAKVIAFLDFFGDWDPSLSFVMVGAIVTFYLFRRVLIGMARPLWGDEFHLPTKDALDAPLLIGAACFGVGWGLLGFCPGPAFVSLTTFEPQTLLFTGAMVGGMLAHTLWNRLRAAPESE